LPVSLTELHGGLGREAVKIRQESQGVMNRDEGAYQLSHIYDKLLVPFGRLVGSSHSEEGSSCSRNVNNCE